MTTPTRRHGVTALCLTLAAVLFTLTHMPRANAVEVDGRTPQIPDGGQSWCLGKWQLRGDLWTQHGSYTSIHISHLITYAIHHRLSHTAMLGYLYCKQPGPNKVEVQWVDDCWAFTIASDEEHEIFAGVLAKTRAEDSSGRWSDSGGHLVDDVNHRQHCETDLFSDAERIPMRMDRDPHWRHSTKIRKWGPDQDWKDWHTHTGAHIKFVHPRGDVKLSGWRG